MRVDLEGGRLYLVGTIACVWIAFVGAEPEGNQKRSDQKTNAPPNCPKPTQTRHSACFVLHSAKNDLVLILFRTGRHKRKPHVNETL